MERMIYKCDNCKKSTNNYYDEIGWIIFEPTSIIVTKGRNKKREAQTGYQRNCGQSLHYCSTDCLIKVINRLKKEKPKI